MLQPLPVEIIPVVDLLGGQVVHARCGDRASYRPLQSPLCDSSEPGHVVERLLALTRARRCYLADLDAIQGQRSQQALIESLVARYPTVEFWVDRGAQVPVSIRYPNLATVLGTESFCDIQALLKALKQAANAATILSLDFKNAVLLGPPEILNHGASWPNRVIIMTLDHVGSTLGPALETIRRLARPGHVEFYAAGGVRGPADLQALAQAQVCGALVASALHKGSLPPR